MLRKSRLVATVRGMREERKGIGVKYGLGQAWHGISIGLFTSCLQEFGWLAGGVEDAGKDGKDGCIIWLRFGRDGWL